MKSIGFQGSAGEEIGVLVEADHGDDHMQFLAVMQTHKFSNHSHCLWYRFLGPPDVSSSRNTRGNSKLTETDYNVNDNLCATF